MAFHELLARKTELPESSSIKANQVISCTRLTMNPLLQYSTTPLDFSHFAVQNQPQFERMEFPGTFVNWPCRCGKNMKKGVTMCGAWPIIQNQ